MRVPRRALDAYSKAIKKQGAGAEAAARRLLRAFMDANPDAPVEDVREFVIATLMDVGTTYGIAAGDAAIAFRDIIATEAGVAVPSITYAYVPERESVERTVRYQARHLVNGDRDAFVDGIADAARFYAERGANETMFRATSADERRLGRRVRFARVPSGPTTCEFCLMLASRGFVYRSAKTAGDMNEFHRHCDCRIVPGYDGTASVEGYDPDALYDEWRAVRDARLEAEGGSNSQ